MGGGGGGKSPAYLITFDPNGGTAAYESDTTGADGTLDTLPTPTRDGYSFNGWFTAKTDGDTVTTRTVFKKDTTIYAQWTEENVIGIDTTVTDTTVTDTTVTDTTVTDTTAVDTTAVDTTKTPETYAVTFNSRGGSAVEPQLIEHGGTIEEPADPTRTDNQNFAGWYRDSTSWTDEWDFAAAVTEPITLYARWTTRAVHTVTFNTLIDGAEHITQPVIDGEKAIFSAAARTGYTLAGWYKDSILTAAWNFAADSVKSDVTLYAKWTINKYVVKFVGYDETVLKLDTVNYNSAAAAPTPPTRTGYTFKNWDKAYSAVTDTLTVKAVYEMNVYTITFDANGGDALDPASGETGAGWKLTLTSLPTPTRSGYAFNGWFTEKTDGTAVTINYVYSDDTAK
jgi:uncharacterized repeat protein (TIGR02543 family)